MEVILSTPCEVPSHECVIKLFSTSQINFCKVCSVFLGSNHLNQPQDHQNKPTLDKRETQKKPIRYYRTSYHQSLHQVKIDHEKNLEHMLNKQHKNRFYNQEASHLVVRPKIIDFMTKIHDKFDKGSAILHKAIVLMDSVFSRHQVTYDKIEIIVLLCLHISSKFDESFSNYDPDKSFFKYAQKSYSFNEMIMLEKQLVKILEFQFDVQSPYHFLNFFNNKGVVSDKDIFDLIKIYSNNHIFQNMEMKQNQKNLTNVFSKEEVIITNEILKEMENVNFKLNGGKNKNIEIKFNIQDISEFMNQIKKWNSNEKNNIFLNNVSSKNSNLQEETEEINEGIFGELKECYVNPLWPLFIEFLFQQIDLTNGQNNLNSNILADKNDIFNKENLQKITLNFSEIINSNCTIQEEKTQKNFINETQIDFDQEKSFPPNPISNMNIESFLSSNSNKELPNRTSILFTQKNNQKIPTENSTKTESFIPDFPNLICSTMLSELNFTDFKFTISSSTQTITRLLNCLRLNSEDLPVGLVEVCCSNFENIFEIILKASTEVYSLNKFTSVAVAVSILYISRKLMNFKDIWTQDLSVLTGLSESDIEGCVEHVLNDPSMFKLVNQMKTNFEMEEQETLYGKKKIISFKNILKMYRNKAQKVIYDFRSFEKIIKNQVIFKYFVEKLAEENSFFGLSTKNHLNFNSYDLGKPNISKFDLINNPESNIKSEKSIYQMLQFDINKENITS
jgi:hypothetical protein